MQIAALRTADDLAIYQRTSRTFSRLSLITCVACTLLFLMHYQRPDLLPKKDFKPMFGVMGTLATIHVLGWLQTNSRATELVDLLNRDLRKQIITPPKRDKPLLYRLEQCPVPKQPDNVEEAIKALPIPPLVRKYPRLALHCYSEFLALLSNFLLHIPPDQSKIKPSVDALTNLLRDMKDKLFPKIIHELYPPSKSAQMDEENAQERNIKKLIDLLSGYMVEGTKKQLEKANAALQQVSLSEEDRALWTEKQSALTSLQQSIEAGKPWYMPYFLPVMGAFMKDPLGLLSLDLPDPLQAHFEAPHALAMISNKIKKILQSEEYKLLEPLRDNKMWLFMQQSWKMPTKMPIFALLRALFGAATTEGMKETINTHLKKYLDQEFDINISKQLFDKEKNQLINSQLELIEEIETTYLNPLKTDLISIVQECVIGLCLGGLKAAAVTNPHRSACITILTSGLEAFSAELDRLTEARAVDPDTQKTELVTQQELVGLFQDPEGALQRALLKLKELQDSPKLA